MKTLVFLVFLFILLQSCSTNNCIQIQNEIWVIDTIIARDKVESSSIGLSSNCIIFSSEVKANLPIILEKYDYKLGTFGDSNVPYFLESNDSGCVIGFTHAKNYLWKKLQITEYRVLNTQKILLQNDTLKLYCTRHIF